MRSTTGRLGIIFWLFLAALALRLAVMFYVGVGQPFEKFSSYDTTGYTIPAWNMLQRGVFSGAEQPPYTPDLLRTPGYPLFILPFFALFGKTAVPVIAAQALVGALAVALVWKIAQELEFPPAAGLAAALLLALDPVSILSANRLLTEVVFATELLAGLWLLLVYLRTRRWSALLLAGLLVGLAALTRPIAQYLPLALLPLLFLGGKEAGQARSGWRKAVLAGLAFVLLAGGVTAAWAFRNYRAAGIFTLSDVNNVTLLDYRARPVLADAQGISQEEASQQLSDWIDQQVAARGLTRAEKVALQGQLAWDVMRQHPLETAKMLAKGTAFLLFDPGYTITCTLLDRTQVRYDCFDGRGTMLSGNPLEQALGGLGAMTFVQQFALFFSLILLGTTLLAAAFGALRLIKQRRWAALYLLLGVVVYFVALSAGGDINYRFRVPFFPYLALLAGVGIAWGLEWAQARKK